MKKFEKSAPIKFRLYNDQVVLLQKAEIQLGRKRGEIIRDLLNKFFVENGITIDRAEIYNIISNFRKGDHGAIPYTFNELQAVTYISELPDGLMEVPGGLGIFSWAKFTKWCGKIEPDNKT